MARVVGFGGIFFKSPDPERLLAWYAKWLGIGDGKSSVEFQASALPPRSFIVWSPFPGKTDYFRPSTREFMFNLIVGDLAGALGQVHLGGAQLVSEGEEQQYGRLGRVDGPDGIKCGLGQPSPQHNGRLDCG